jgi:pentatricopeptide repeat protein
MRVGLWVLICSWVAGIAYLAQESKPATNPPADSAAILAEAQSLYRKGSFDPAIARYNDALKADPASGDAYAGIIRCYLKQDRVEEADAVLQKGLQAIPSHPDLKVAEAELLFRQGEIPEAGKLFGEVIAAPPDPTQPNSRPNARAYLGAARVAGASAMYAREHILIGRAHALDASEADIQKLWIESLAMGERVQSLADYLAVPGNDDEDVRARLRERLNFLKASQSVEQGRCRQTSNLTATKINLIPIALGNNAQGSSLNVQINGKPARLLLDTGASGILVSSKLASQGGLTPGAEVRMGGIGDKPDALGHISWATAVQVGNLEFHNCPVNVIDRVPRDSDGLIGADVFAQFLIELDFPNSSLNLSPLPPRPGEAPLKASLNTGDVEPATEPEGQPSADSATGKESREAPRYEDRYIAPEMHSYTQIFRFGHMLLVPTTINENSSKLFLVDTGAFDNTIAPAAAREVTKVHRAPRVDVRGVNGEAKKVYVADHVMVDFGHVRQQVPNMVAIDMSRVSRRAGTEISGTLGMAMLSLLKVRLDYRDALADFQYKPKPVRH